MKRPAHLSDLNDYRKRQAKTEQIRRELVAKTRIRVKAVGRRVAAVKTEVR